MHHDALRHDTPFNVVFGALGTFGTGTGVHAVPFHVAAKGLVTAAMVEVPVAAQNVTDVHETLLKRVSVEPLWFGLGTVDHVVPFHRSIRVVRKEPVGVDVPAPMQKVEVTHETATLSLSNAPADGCGNVADQLEAETVGATMIGDPPAVTDGAERARATAAAATPADVNKNRVISRMWAPLNLPAGS